MEIPKGTKDELEGRLVEHSLELCEYLELEYYWGSGVGCVVSQGVEGGDWKGGAKKRMERRDEWTKA